MPDDSEDHRIQFLSLNDSNYVEWSLRMEAELVENGLWEQVFIEIDVNGKSTDEISAEKAKAVVKRTTRKMAEVRARMIAQVEVSLRKGLSQMKTSLLS
jgi:hypothetical protein